MILTSFFSTFLLAIPLKNTVIISILAIVSLICLLSLLLHGGLVWCLPGCCHKYFLMIHLYYSYCSAIDCQMRSVKSHSLRRCQKFLLVNIFIHDIPNIAIESCLHLQRLVLFRSIMSLVATMRLSFRNKRCHIFLPCQYYYYIFFIVIFNFIMTIIIMF